MTTHPLLAPRLKKEYKYTSTHPLDLCDLFLGCTSPLTFTFLWSKYTILTHAVGTTSSKFCEKDWEHLTELLNTNTLHKYSYTYSWHCYDI